MLLGGKLFGPDAEHLIHLLAWIVQTEMAVDSDLDLRFYHPTLEENLRSALRDPAGQAG